MTHWSSCSTNNGPALPPGPCDCNNDAPASADIILFVPRSNQKADRAFWIGRELTPIEQMACELMDVAVPKEISEYAAPQNDPA